MKIDREICLKSGCRRFTYPEASAVALHKKPTLCVGTAWNENGSQDRSKWTDAGIVPDDCIFKTEHAVAQENA
jgi:hypothetical protein